MSHSPANVARIARAVRETAPTYPRTNGVLSEFDSSVIAAPPGRDGDRTAVRGNGDGAWYRTSGTFPGTHVMSIFSPPTPNRVPLSLRPSHELWARAAELARMAGTARTVDTKIALETLAARFAALAEKRETAEGPELSGPEADGK